MKRKIRIENVGIEEIKKMKVKDLKNIYSKEGLDPKKEYKKILRRLKK